jgi:hypothetical protein
MSRVAIVLFILTAVVLPSPSHADRTYKVYKANEFGRRSLLGSPDAVIQVDEFTGEAKVYEPNLFGEADILEGPKYIIESDMPFSGPHHSHFNDLTSAPTDHHRKHHRHADEEECEEE